MYIFSDAYARKTWKKGISERLSSLGILISYTRVLELSTVLGNDVLRQYKEYNRISLFQHITEE